jgi:hypothetical protein
MPELRQYNPEKDLKLPCLREQAPQQIKPAAACLREQAHIHAGIFTVKNNRNAENRSCIKKRLRVK